MMMSMGTPSNHSKQILATLNQKSETLVDDDPLGFECLLDVLVELLEEKYGCTRQKAREEVSRFLANKRSA
jgi:hypothetical protein